MLGLLGCLWRFQPDSVSVNRTITRLAEWDFCVFLRLGNDRCCVTLGRDSLFLRWFIGRSVFGFFFRSFRLV